MSFRSPLLIISFALLGCTNAASGDCQLQRIEAVPYTICRADPGDTLQIRLDSMKGERLGDFARLRDEVEREGGTLSFAVNGGMYHEDRSPVGLYIEDGETRQSLNTNEGPGNFHMLPNGVFWISKTKGGQTASVATAETYKSDAKDVTYATQSGPMLVINGALHPQFNAESDSQRLRNGVGQSADGTLWFVTSDVAVNFHSFARMFRDHLKTPNALYLDGTVSKVYSADLGRDDKGLQMGPMIAKVEPID